MLGEQRKIFFALAQPPAWIQQEDCWSAVLLVGRALPRITCCNALRTPWRNGWPALISYSRTDFGAVRQVQGGAGEMLSAPAL